MNIDRTKFLFLCASMVPVVAIACSSGGGDGTAGGGSAVSGPASGAATGVPEGGAPAHGDTVTVNTKTLSSKTDKCTLDVKAPTVSIPTNKTAEAAINKVLEELQKSPCDEGDGVDAESSFEVTANDGRLLSIRVTGDSFFEGAAHPNGFAETFNFDVENGGKQLKLSDVLTAAGTTKTLAACTKSIDQQLGDDMGNVDEAGVGAPTAEGSEGADDCRITITPDPQFHFETPWLATKDGLEIEVGVPHAAGDVMPATVAWKDLGTDGLTPNTVVADFAKAQK